MSDPQSAREMYHGAALEEYRKIRDEIVTDVVEQNKIIGLVMGSFPVAATVFTLFSPKDRGIVEFPAVLLFLGSAVYSTFVLYLVKFFSNMRGQSAYLKNELLPRLEGNLRLVGGEGFEGLEQPIRWEYQVGSYISLPWPLKPITWSSFVIPFLPALLLAWQGWRQVRISAIDHDRWFGYGAVALLAYTIISSVIVGFSLGVHPKRGLLRGGRSSGSRPPSRRASR